MKETPPIRMDSPTDPNRCQATNARGQCEFKGILLPDGTYGKNCILHGGNRQVDSQNLENLKNYRLTKWQAKVNRFSESNVIKSLREEIGILRVLLEERLNRIDNAADLVLQSAPISDLVMKVEKVVGSCHNLEAKMGQHLDKAAVLHLASRFVAVISEQLSDQPDKIDSISHELLNIIQEDMDESS